MGLGSYQVQEAEWFGPDCSMRHCPSGNDPTTIINETDCSHHRQRIENNIYNIKNGSIGNLCHVDCSNRGICDYKSGLCTCFTGFQGSSCDVSSHFFNEPDSQIKINDGGIFSHLPVDVNYRL